LPVLPLPEKIADKREPEFDKYGRLLEDPSAMNQAFPAVKLPEVR